MDGGWGLLDFWESRGEFDAFAAQIPEAFAAVGVRPQGPPDIHEFPVHETISARGQADLTSEKREPA